MELFIDKILWLANATCDIPAYKKISCKCAPIYGKILKSSLREEILFVNSGALTGNSFPLGTTVYPSGVNFCIFSNACEALELLFFDDADSAKPSRIIKFDPKINKTFYYWHIFVPGIKSGQLYGYRAYGPFDLVRGYRFDGKKVLLDPYARAVMVGENYSREAAASSGNNCAYAMKGVIIDTKKYNWEGDKPPNKPYKRSVIYELHVGGFTRHPNSGVAAKKRGTYAGLIEKIPYLKSLGITAVELMPIQQFDEQDAAPPLSNYWGYSPVAFFAPHQGYSSRKDPTGAVDEFRDMVKALHKAGIEVILDVVFNHTAEGDHNGPTISFKGLENPAYYILEKDKRCYANCSGCGNTLNANHSIVRRLIENCLCHWVMEMHVDGFRFDLASVMSRGEKGEILENPPVLWTIESNPILAGTKIIAEVWDAAGAYQLGSFIGDRFAEWNGQFRDDVRRFVKGDNDTVIPLVRRIVGSPDIFKNLDREPGRSINFVTCHDGFTLNDLVSYDQKHNEANNENNRDGDDKNYSWNCGVEGPTDNKDLEKLRLQQIKNFITILFVSQGTPMILMGDEVRRTQMGNNNMYCQNNEISWFDWDGLKKHKGLLRFVKKLINDTRSLDAFHGEYFWIAPKSGLKREIIWHGTKLNQPDGSAESHSIAFSLQHKESGHYFHVMLNAYWNPLGFELPRLVDRRSWRRIINTALPSPDDFCDPKDAPVFRKDKYWVEARSVVVLMAR